MVLGTVGDLVEDVVVDARGLAADVADQLVPGNRIALEVGADTPVTVARRRGGSAANVAATAAKLGGRVRFIGQVGEDAVGHRLVAQLAAEGVEPVMRYQGRTGTVVVLCHDAADARRSSDAATTGAAPERTMLTDRGASVDLDDPDPVWLAGLSRLHVPLYSLLEGALAQTCRTLIDWAGERRIAVSIDLSATSAIRALGVRSVRNLLVELAPEIVFANEAEAELVSDDGRRELGSATVVEKRGADPARLWLADGGREEIPAIDLGLIADTTGAGDAFAAGFLVARSNGDDPVDSVRSAHRAAADHLRRIRRGLS